MKFLTHLLILHSTVLALPVSPRAIPKESAVGSLVTGSVPELVSNRLNVGIPQHNVHTKSTTPVSEEDRIINRIKFKVSSFFGIYTLRVKNGVVIGPLVDDLQASPDLMTVNDPKNEATFYIPTFDSEKKVYMGLKSKSEDTVFSEVVQLKVLGKEWIDVDKNTLDGELETYIDQAGNLRVVQTKHLSGSRGYVSEERDTVKYRIKGLYTVGKFQGLLKMEKLSKKIN